MLVNLKYFFLDLRSKNNGYFKDVAVGAGVKGFMPQQIINTKSGAIIAGKSWTAVTPERVS